MHALQLHACDCHAVHGLARQVHLRMGPLLTLPPTSRSPSKPRAPAQEALLAVLERALSEPSHTSGCTLQPPPPGPLTARLLVFKHEIGAVLGLRGAVVGEIRARSGAAVRIEDDAGDKLPLALADDQLVQVGAGDGRLPSILKFVEVCCKCTVPSCTHWQAGARLHAMAHLQPSP